MTDWIFEGNPRGHDLHAAVAASRWQWWSTPRYRDRTAVHDRVWLQIAGPHLPGIYYLATITTATYGSSQPPVTDSAYGRWRTDIRFDYRIDPPLLRSELLEDAKLGSFRPFRGFQGSTVPLPPDIASTLSDRAAARLRPIEPTGIEPPA
jgi:hypothetical protein